MTDATPDASNTAMTVVRLLQNPLGQEALPGQRGDIVRVSDGRARMYLLPGEYDNASPATLRWMLAREPGRSPAAAGTGR
jgi:Ribosomal protein L9, N-terminal domain